MLWEITMRLSIKPKQRSLRIHWLVGQQTGSSGSDYANVGMRAPRCGGFTTQQPSDLAWASSSPPLKPLLCSPPACLSVNPSNTITQLRKTKKGRRRRTGWGGFLQRYSTLVLFLWMSVGDWGMPGSYSLWHCFSHLRCSYFFCISVKYSLFLPPLGIFTVFVLFCFFVFESIFTV